MKHVTVIGHRFNSLPGHITVQGRGKGATLRSALCDAIRKMLAEAKLKHRHHTSFSISVEVHDA
ncbi:MAG TPA: hypothetical protein VND65_01815 [Candidatus Binatia bacterium]|nr:hypothetical protein [Candidatus Binatia bacterium]